MQSHQKRVLMDLDPLLRFKTEIKNSGDTKVLVLYFSGKITSDNIFDLNHKIKTIFKEGIYNCILYLSELEYINSTGIAMLLTIAKTIEQNSGKLVLTKPTSFVKDLFDMTDLDTRFEIVEDVDSALALFK